MSAANPRLRYRRFLRLKNHDYRQAGAYYVTICTQSREFLLGEVVDGVMQLNAFGKIVEREWLNTAAIRPSVELDAFVVMPNHIHVIIMLTDQEGATHRQEGATHRVAATTTGEATARVARTTRAHGPASGSLGAIIGQFKSVVTKEINQLRTRPGAPVWQPNYYEHVIRNEQDLECIRAYIANNPGRWAEDSENPTTPNP